MNNQELADNLYIIVRNLDFLVESDADESPENCTSKAYQRDDAIETRTYHMLIKLLRDKHYLALDPKDSYTDINDLYSGKILHLSSLDAIEYCWDMGTDFQDDYQIIDDYKVSDLLGIYVDNNGLINMNKKKRDARPDTRYFTLLARQLGSVYAALPIQSKYDNNDKALIYTKGMTLNQIDEAIRDYFNLGD